MAITLAQYISCPVRKAALAAATGASAQYLWQVAAKWRGKRASTELAKLIEQHTDGEVTKESLRPDVWEVAPETRAGAAA